MAGLPSSDVRIRMEGATHPEQVSLSEWSVDASSRITRIGLQPMAMIDEIMILAAAAMAAGVATGTLRLMGRFRRGYGAASTVQWPGGVVFSTMVVAAARHFDPARLPPNGVLMTLGIVSIWMIWSEMRTRIAFMAAALAVAAAVEAFKNDIVPPHPALAGLYGWFGLMSWDVAWLLTVSLAAFLSAWLAWPRAFRVPPPHQAHHGAAVVARQDVVVRRVPRRCGRRRRRRRSCCRRSRQQ